MTCRCSNKLGYEKTEIRGQKCEKKFVVRNVKSEKSTTLMSSVLSVLLNLQHVYSCYINLGVYNNGGKGILQ